MRIAKARVSLRIPTVWPSSLALIQYLLVKRKDSDQTALMRRLTWAFAVRTCEGPVLSWCEKAVTQKRHLISYANSQCPDQPAHPRRLIWALAVHLHTVSSGENIKLWSYCDDAQTDLGIRYSYICRASFFPDVTFATRYWKKHYHVWTQTHNMLAIFRKLRLLNI